MDHESKQHSTKIDLQSIRRGPILTAMIIGAFVSLLNETLLNVAFPQLMEQFRIEEPTVQWLVTIYMLVVGILVPVTALLQQWFTTRQMFIGAMTFFFIGTLICGVTPIFSLMILGRILQAIGAGLVVPVLINTILIIFPIERRGSAMGMIGLVMMTAPAIGPVLSGLIVDILHWRWLFFIILPLTAFSILFSMIYLQNVTEITKPRVDMLSIILSTIGFGSIVYGFSRAGEVSWDDAVVLGCMIVGLLVLFVFSWRQLRMKEPMLDLRAFRYPVFSIVSLLVIVMMMSMFSTSIILPIYLQKVLGMTAFVTGLMLMPGGIVNGIMAPISGKIFDRFGPRVIVIPGIVITCVSLYLFSSIDASWTGTYVIFLHVIMMIGISMVMMPAQTTGVNHLPQELYPHGVAILSTLQQIAGALGTALFISIMSNGAKQYAMTTGDMNPIQGMVAGLQDAFIVGFLLALGALLLSVFVKQQRK